MSGDYGALTNATSGYVAGQNLTSFDLVVVCWAGAQQLWKVDLAQAAQSNLVLELPVQEFEPTKKRVRRTRIVGPTAKPDAASE